MVARMEIRDRRQLEEAASPNSSAQSIFAELQQELITLIISLTILQFLLSHGVLTTDVAISGCYIASSNIVLPGIPRDVGKVFPVFPSEGAAHGSCCR